MLQRGLFRINDFYSLGYHNPHCTWEGWSLPYFSFDQMHDILHWYMCVYGSEFVYCEATDTFTVYGDDGAASERFAGVEVKGLKLYPIDGWTWEEVDTVPYQLLIEDGGLTDDTVYTVYNLSQDEAVYLRSYDKQAELFRLLKDHNLLTVGHSVAPDIISYPDLLVPASLAEEWAGVYFPA